MNWNDYEKYFFIILSGVRLSPLVKSATVWPIVPAPDDRLWWVWSSRWNANWQRKRKYSEKTCSSATLSTTNPAWPHPGSNPGSRGGKLATNSPSYGAALWDVTILSKFKVVLEFAWMYCGTSVTAGCLPQPPGFDPMSECVGFVVDNVALGHVSSEYFGFPCHFSFHRLLRCHPGLVLVFQYFCFWGNNAVRFLDSFDICPFSS
jgi:hypothetical protein